MQSTSKRITRFVQICIIHAVASISVFAQSAPPALFSDLQWRLIGPFRAGRAVVVGGASDSSPVFYFGSVDGGVWKTSDAGMVWKPKFDQQPVASIGALEVAPSDAKTIYVGTGETDIRSDLASGDGVYKSIDGGESWKNVGLRGTRQISKIAIDPSDANTAYVGALGYAYGNNPDRGVYKTIDGGATWKRVLYKNDATGVADLALVPQHPNVLFACMWDAHRPPWSQYPPVNGPGSGLYRSKDGGETWQQLNGHGLPEGRWGRSGVAVSADGRRVYALIAAKKAGIYVSDDGGDTWEYRNSDARLTGRDWYFSRITIDPQHPDTFYVPNTALYRSIDAGKTLDVVRGAPGGDDYHELWVDPKNSDRMILGTDHGTTISIDHGATWTSWYNQPTGQMYHVTTDDQFPYVVYGAQQDDGSIGVYSRTDHESIAPRDWFIAAQSESGYIAVDPLHTNILYVSSSYGGVVKFDKKTSLSQEITPWPTPSFGSDISQRRYRATWTPVLVMSPADKTSLYLGTQYILKTVDGGSHWTKISPDLTGATEEIAKAAVANEDAASASNRGSAETNEPVDPPTTENSIARGYGTIFTIAPSPRDAGIIWSGSDTGLLYLTRNGGKTWSNVTPSGVGPWSKISLVEASRFDPAVAYVAVDRHRLDDREPYLYRTRDFGKTWTKIVDGLAEPNFAYAIREDTKQRGLLFAGTEFGIYVSFDDGQNWQPLQLNLPVTSVRDMTVHGDDLIVATHGRAFWILDDITPLRQIAEARAASGAFLYQPAVAIRVDHDPFPSTRVPVDEPTAKNPPEGAIISYYLPTEAREVTLHIYDSKNRLVREFSSSKAAPTPQRAPAIAEAWRLNLEPLRTTAGMHRFVWSLTWSSSGEMDSDLPDAGSGLLRLPRAAPGRYRIVLNVDGKELTRTLDVKMDPRSTATLLALQQQQELGVRIYGGYRKAEQAIAEIQRTLGVKGSSRQSTEQGNAASGDPRLRRLLDGDSKSVEDSLGLIQIEASLASDLAAVRSGYDAPTSQDEALYLQLDNALELRLAEWRTLATAAKH
jgi:photosystem II stability/assembly factor-like uncharacterized protein